MKAGGMELTIAVGWFPVPCGGDMAIVNFHSGVYEINLLGGVFLSQFNETVEVLKSWWNF